MIQSEFKPPWEIGELKHWSIVGMNHYHKNGKKYLWVCMGIRIAPGMGFYIQEEGEDQVYLWNRLAEKAENTKMSACQKFVQEGK